MGRPQDAGRWYEEKRRHAPVYMALGGGAIAATAILAWAGRGSLEPWNRVMLVTLGAVLGGTVLAFGPLLYWMARRHTIWLEMPMQEGWTGDALSLGDALKGYLSSQGVRWVLGRFVGPPSHGLVLRAHDGLRLMLLIGEIPNDRKGRRSVYLSIHCINPDNVEAAEAMQRALDGWPLLGELKAGLDAELDAEIASGAP